MGKAARNEQRKLQATRASNLSVGLLIAGFFVPYFTFVSKAVERLGPFDLGTLSDWKQAAAALGPAILAFALSISLRKSAFKFLEEIED